MKIFFYALAAIAACLWGIGYLWATAMACAYTNSSDCSIRLPWQMQGEDLIILVIAPATIVGSLLLLGILSRPRKK